MAKIFLATTRDTGITYRVMFKEGFLPQFNHVAERHVELMFPGHDITQCQ